MNSLRKIMMNTKPMMAILIALALSLTGVVGLTPALAEATTSKTNITFPIDGDVFNPCTAVGEIVHISGNIHFVETEVFDASGGIHITDINSSQEISGTGLTTGDKYQVIFGGQDHEFISIVEEGANLVGTSLTTGRVIGEGPGNNFVIHENFHFTMLADGTITAFVDNITVECQ
jgi:hypothetical protein